jgi:SWI/SNF-related matrix-associated actin-dependent regulator 1 of chromatin subfamily A
MPTKLELPTNLYRVNSLMAIGKEIPTYFNAATLRETEKAIYLYGYGEIDPSYHCARCGKILTHPVSQQIGIGPECLQKWGINVSITEILPEQIISYQKIVQNKKVDAWFPKSCVKKCGETGKFISVPTNHAFAAIKTKIPKNSAELLPNGDVKLTFSPTAEMLNKVKALPNRTFVSKGDHEKYWSVSVRSLTLPMLQGWGFSISKELELLLEQSEKTTVITEIKGLHGTLFPYQTEGVAFLEEKNGNAILGDEMGLGKTMQALAFLQLHPEFSPAVIIAPVSGKYHWKQKAEEWLSNDRHITLLETMTVSNLTAPQDIVILSYNLVSKWITVLKQLRPKILIFDECHYIKNNQAQRTKAVKKLAKNIPHIIPISGTLILNRPREIYNSVHMVDPTMFPNYMEFAKRYCGAKHTIFGWDCDGATNLEELHEKLKSLMIRRKKSEVLPQLPEKQKTLVPMKLTNYAEYEKADNDFLIWVKENKGTLAMKKAANAIALNKITTLRQIAARGALKYAKEWIQDFLESGEKLVVFAIHKEIITELMKEFGDIAVKIDGSTSSKGSVRMDIQNAFQTDPAIKLFIGNIVAAGTVLTLTAASNAAFLELPWTPGELDQAEDRIHRIGTKNAVNIWYLLPIGTIEETLAKVIDRKKSISSAIMDGETTSPSSMISALIDEYSKKIK